MQLNSVLSSGRSDPLPFILLSDEKKSGRSGHTVFVDIDYEKLMVHKKNAIRNTKEITGVLGDVEFGSDQDAVQLRSSRYIAVGCDLKNLKKLDDVLRHCILPSEECSVLFLAEVSLTYMDVKSANEVVKWASKLTKGESHSALGKGIFSIRWLADTWRCQTQMFSFVSSSNTSPTVPTIHSRRQ